MYPSASSLVVGVVLLGDLVVDVLDEGWTTVSARAIEMVRVRAPSAPMEPWSSSPDRAETYTLSDDRRFTQPWRAAPRTSSPRARSSSGAARISSAIRSISPSRPVATSRSRYASATVSYLTRPFLGPEIMMPENSPYVGAPPLRPGARYRRSAIATWSLSDRPGATYGW